VFAPIEVQREGCFTLRFLASRFETQDLRERPVRFKPIGMRRDGGAQAALRAGCVIAGSVDLGRAIVCGISAS
jgi:hypothetical protein